MEERMEFCLKAIKSTNFRKLCQEYGISAKTGYKWRERFLEQGSQGMMEESRRPHAHPESLGEEELCRIIRLKNAHLNWGPKKIRELYARRYGKAASESSFKRVLERSGLTEKRKRTRKVITGGRLSSGLKAQEPNQVWSVDFKGWWRLRERRCEPLTVRDEYSRFLLELRDLGDAKTQTVKTSFERLFERYGLPQAMRSDNGTPFASVTALHGLSRLSAWWMALGIDLERSRPAHPQDNGAHERLHLDISRQLEGLGKGDQDSLDLWRQEFNHERPHEALSMRCPAELYRHSSRKYQGALEQLDYPQMATRKVDPKGVFSWHDDKFFLSTSLTGWNVGLKTADANLTEVWFSRLLLGWIDPATTSFIRSDLGSEHSSVNPNRN
jgi:putative transposase